MRSTPVMSRGGWMADDRSARVFGDTSRGYITVAP
jgi:hypothetical protein